MNSINAFLQQINSQAPALLQVGVDRGENYRNLAALSSMLQEGDQSPWSALGSSSGSLDTVTLAYQKIGDKVITDLAALTADVLKEETGLEGDYVLALIETDRGQEARVYRRSEILAGLEGEEKKALQSQLEADPLIVLDGTKKWPPSSSDPACQALADKAGAFLKIAAKTLNSLNKAGYDPLLDFKASASLEKALLSAEA